MSEENQSQPIVQQPASPPANAPMDIGLLLQSGVEIMRQITVEPERVRCEFELKKAELESATQNRIFLGLFIIIGLVVVIAGYMAFAGQFEDSRGIIVLVFTFFGGMGLSRMFQKRTP